MRTKDIKTGGDYAWTRWPRSSHSHTRMQRVHVLETGVERSVGRFSWNQQTRRDGVRCQFLMENGRKLKDHDVTLVPAEQIVRTWDDELQARKEADEADQKADREEFEATVLATRVKGYLAMLGLKDGVWPHQEGDYSFGGRYDKFEFTGEEMLNLLTLVKGARPFKGRVLKSHVKPDEFRIYINGAIVGEYSTRDEAKKILEAVNA